MQDIYILTSDQLPELGPDDQKLVKALEEYDLKGIPVIWDQWTPIKNATVLVRTIWDYFIKTQAFVSFLNELDHKNCTCICSTDIIRWNMNKKYLLELQQLGVRTVPTWIFDNFKLEDLKIKKITPPFVIKPLIGGAGLNTFLINSQEQSKNCEPLLGTSVLIQPFIKSIQTVGEYSFIFFANEFSHAVLKCAKAGEFRVQDDHGGTVQDFKPNAKELQQVQDMLSKIPKAFHYARVDVVPIEGKLTLMELEVIEPELFFRFSESGLQKYCEMIQYGSH